MNDIEELQRRITSAMDRMASGLDGLSTADNGKTAELEQALDDEKTVNAQLNERIRALTVRQERELAEAQTKADDAATLVGALDLELQRMRKANAELRQSNQDLRAANEAGVGEPHLINKAMMAELEALRATRAADVAEADTIIQALTPLLDAKSDTAQESV
jgi:hypothetical protein